MAYGLDKIEAIGIDERAWEDGATVRDGQDDTHYQRGKRKRHRNDVVNDCTVKNTLVK